MSRTHKPKPPDKGESAPKPSRKVAIEEVLRSLQDLVNNELSVAAPPAEARPLQEADVVPVAPPAPESGFLIPFEPAPALARNGDTGTNATISLEALPESVAETAPAPEPAPLAKEPLPPEGLQQELPYLEPEPAIETPVTAAIEPSSLLLEPDFPGPELPGTDELDDRSIHITSIEKETEIEPAASPDMPIPALPADDLPELEPVASDPILETSGTGTNSALADADSLNDIPVLEDAVDLHDELEPHPNLDESSLPAAALPAAQDGRRLAIQVAARLNVELRKAGQPGLSSDVIARLAHLLEETLAKGAPNMENSAKTKH